MRLPIIELSGIGNFPAIRASSTHLLQLFYKKYNIPV